MDELIQFVDRLAQHPGRVKLAPVAGEVNTYDLVWADDPINEGTPLNAEWFNALIDSIPCTSFGSYVGTGSMFTLHLGFKPRLFIVAASKSFSVKNGSITSTYNGLISFLIENLSFTIQRRKDSSSNSETVTMAPNLNFMPTTDDGVEVLGIFATENVTYMWAAIG